MMRVLVSVQTEDECQLVLDAGVPMIDFKDAKAGALGMLDLALTRRLCHQVYTATHSSNVGFTHAEIMLSATLGDTCPAVHALERAILDRMECAVAVIKLPVAICMAADYQETLRRQIRRGLKLIAVFSPQQLVAPAQWQAQVLHCAKEAYFGVMVDTIQKSTSLMSQVTPAELQKFVQVAKSHHLFVGLAGGLTAADIDQLVTFQPDYLGFRGGVCEQSQRTSVLSATRLQVLMQKCRIHA